MRVLGVDWGERRVGLALAGELRIAVPAGCLVNDGNLFAGLRELIRREGVERIVVGEPKTLRGEAGDMVRRVEEFCVRLVEETGLPVERCDERRTTAEAERCLRQAPKKKKEKARRDGTRDSLAACLILAAWLEGRS